MEKTIKCPYCGGETLIANAAARIICEYCDEEIILSNTVDEQVSCGKTEGRLNGIDLFKLSPKKDCQECGSPTCMAFCLKVAQGAEETDKCPYFSEEAKMRMGKTSAKGVNLILTNAGSSKLETIKIIREYTGLGLKEAKDIVDSVPSTVKSNISHTEATAIIKELAAIGAVAELCTSGKEPVSEEESPADKLLNVYIQTLGNDALETWQTMCGCLNSEYSYDEYIDLLEGMAKDKPDRITTPAINNTLYKKIAERVSSQLLPGEKMLFYIDSGILSSGKGGVLITSARVFGLKKKDINLVRYEDVKSIYATESAVTWKINNEIPVDCYHCSYKQLGIILAFVLYMSRTCHTDGYKINAYQK